MYRIDMEIPAFIVSFLCFIFSLANRRRQYIFPKGIKNKLTNQHFIFILLLISLMTASLSSIIGVQLTYIKEMSPALAFWQYFFHMMYFFFHTTLALTFTLYIMNVNGTIVGRKKSFFILFALPYIISEVLVITNVFTKLVFYMDGPTYVRGPLMPILYALCAIYIILGFVFFFKYKKAISNEDSIAIGTSIIFATVGIIIQALAKEMLVELFAEALAISFLMIILEEKTGHIDIVTGARNRVALSDTNRRLFNSKQDYSIIIVSLLNLTSFEKLYNDKDIDRLLMDVSNYLTTISGMQNLYYYKHNSFAIIVEHNNHINIDSLQRRLLDRFEKEWKVGNIEFNLNVLICKCHVPTEITSMEELNNLFSIDFEDSWSGNHLLKYSDLSIYQQNIAIEKALRRTIEEKKLVVFYQPIWSSETEKTIAAEALLRVDDDELRQYSPQIYIPIAEKCGLIDDIGFFVFEEVCKTLTSEEIQKTTIEYIELNLSIYQFANDELIDKFEEIRNKYNVPANKINLEITETASTNIETSVTDKIRKLHNIGYEFSLDDFGTGHSNLLRLMNSDYKNIKIDKTILWDAMKNEGNSDLIKGIIKVIRNAGYNMVQEGVETKEVLARVINAGCNLIQGYYFSKPVPYSEFIDYLNNESSQNI